MKKNKWIVLWLFILCASQTFAAACGDANLSGNIDIVDALTIAQYSVGLSVSVFDALAADVNGDKGINILDALMVAQYTVGLINQLSGCQPPAPTGPPMGNCAPPSGGKAISHGVKLVGYGSGTTGGGGSEL